MKTILALLLALSLVLVGGGNKRVMGSPESDDRCPPGYSLYDGVCKRDDSGKSVVIVPGKDKDDKGKGDKDKDKEKGKDKGKGDKDKGHGNDDDRNDDDNPGQGHGKGPGK